MSLKTIDSFRGAYAFLSNMYDSPLALKNPEGHIHIFRCTEAAFQSKKTSDPAEIAKFTRLDGKAAKAYGKKLPCAQLGRSQAGSHTRGRAY